jgi:hypothetical protein
LVLLFASGSSVVPFSTIVEPLVVASISGWLVADLNFNEQNPRRQTRSRRWRVMLSVLFALAALAGVAQAVYRLL